MDLINRMPCSFVVVFLEISCFFFFFFLSFQGCAIYLTLFDERCLFGSWESEGIEIENSEFE